MPSGLRNLLEKIFKIEANPAPPEGEDLLVFRAAPSYYLYSLLGSFVSLALLTLIAAGIAWVLNLPGLPKESGLDAGLLRALSAVPFLLIVMLLVMKLLVARLDYEYRCYMVTDEGLRIREGVMSVQEITMAFKNIQNISVTQGPLQRLMGLSDLVVQTAGGSVGAHSQQGSVVSGHVGYFRGVDNVEEIREMMMTRLRAVQGSGVGESEHEVENEQPVSTFSGKSLDLLKLIGVEAEKLRTTVGGSL